MHSDMLSEHIVSLLGDAEVILTQLSISAV